MAQPIKVTILGDIKDLVQSLTKGEGSVAQFATSVGTAASDVAKQANKFAAAGLAAGGIGGAIVESLDRGKITAALGAALGATPEEAAKYGQAAGQLYAQGYGQSFAEVSTAIEGVVSTLGKFGSQGELEAVTRKAMDVASAFGLDVQGAVTSVGILLKTGLAKDANEAFDLITKGLQNVPASVRQELLEASDEYTVFFKDMGFSGQEAFGVLAKAAEGGKMQLDKAGDAIKEFNIRSVDMSTTSVAAYKAIGLDAEAMAKRILAGGDSAKTAFQQILDGVLSIKDPVKQETAAVGLFGTQFEDLGNIDALAALRPMTNALGEVGGAADKLGDQLHSSASTNIDQFTRALQTAFVDIVGGKVIPVITEVVNWLRTNLGPALSAVGGFLNSTVIPALGALASVLWDNRTAIVIVAGLITAVFLPGLIAAGVQATISAAKQVAAWVAMRVQATQTAVTQAAASATSVAAWIRHAATATVQAARVVGAYVLVAAQATVNAARVAAAWALAQVRTLATLALMAAQFIAQGAVMVASMVATAARVVAQWALMGAQALIRGAQMAAAWVIAMGPVGWVIAAVVGLVALIVSNWDTVVAWTKAAWQWVVDAVVGAAQWLWDLFLNWTLPGLIIKHWDTIVAGVRSAVNWVLDAVGWFGQLPGRVGAWFQSVRDGAVGKLAELVAWIRGLPGMILGALGDFGSLLLNLGRSLLEGLWRGIQNAAGWLRDKIVGFFKSLIPDWIKDALGINSPSRVVAEIGKWIPPGLAVGIEGNAAPALAAARGLADAVAAEMGGTDFGTPMGFSLAAAGTAASARGARGAPGGTSDGRPAPVGGPGSGASSGTTVNVYATTNADPNRIGSEVAWAVRNTGR